MAKTKGFRFGKASEKVTISFAQDHALSGLEIVVEKAVPVGVVLGASAGDVPRAIEPLIARIISWNLEDSDGNPVPVSRKAFDELFDLEAAGQVATAWVEAVVGVSGPLEQP
jgi:hypothetical protein